MHDSDVIIRAATVADALPLAALLARVFAETYGAMIPAATLTAYLEHVFAPSTVAADIANSVTPSLVATSGGAIIGASVLASGAPDEHPLSGAVELARLYVHAAWQGRGVAGALLGSTFAAARAQGFTTVWLCVWARNERALAFYRKQGFAPFGHAPVFVDNIRFDDLLMQRTLNDY